MRFSASESRRFGRPTDGAASRLALFAAAVTGVVAASQPWVRVRFERLFGEVFGPPAWQSSAGFTCMCTCALVLVMALAETGTATTRRAVRPASLLLAAIMTLAFALHVARGPGMLRGVSAAWTLSVFVAGGACATLLIACASRALPAAGRRREDAGPQAP